jgi:predicted Zn-dependent protease
MKTNLTNLLCVPGLLVWLMCGNAQADTTNRWAAMLEGAQRLAVDYAKTNYPQFFPEVPVTKRTEFNLLSVQQESELGNQVWVQFATNVIPADLIEAQKRLTNIAFPLVTAANTMSNIPPCSFEFRMIADSNFNAFCIAGGKIVVNSGVLSVVRNDDEFSFVIAHEIGHALARHAGETMTRDFVRQKGLGVAHFIADWAERQKHIQKGTVTNILEGLDAATVLTVNLPHKRDQEVEADHLGLMLMSKAGYRPQAAIDLWERMATSQTDTNSFVARAIAKYCNDHPPDAERVANLKMWLPEATNYLRKASQ